MHECEAGPPFVMLVALASGYWDHSALLREPSSFPTSPLLEMVTIGREVVVTSNPVSCTYGKTGSHLKYRPTGWALRGIGTEASHEIFTN